MSTKFGTIVLVHNWTHERNTVPVETVTRTYVSIRWGQSGTYDLNLKDNVLTARSQKAQRKGKPNWKAEDIAAVRHMVKVHLDGTDKKAETRKAMATHVASMPGVAGPEHIGSILQRSNPRIGFPTLLSGLPFNEPTEHDEQDDEPCPDTLPERPDLGARSEYDPRCLGTNGQGHVTCCRCVG